MLCLIGYLVALAGAFTWRFLRGAWRDIELTGDDELNLPEALTG